MPKQSGLLITGYAIGVAVGSPIITALTHRSAIALMFTGLTIAIVTGVPLGTFIGQTFGWRATFGVVTLLGVIAVIASAILIPNHLKQSPPAKFSDMLRLGTNGRLLLGFAITALGYGGTFVAFTYLTPILQDVVKLSPKVVGIVLIAMSFMIPFKAAGLITVFLMGLLAFMNVPGLQLYVVQLAEKYVPSAVDVASALNIAAPGSAA